MVPQTRLSAILAKLGISLLQLQVGFPLDPRNCKNSAGYRPHVDMGTVLHFEMNTGLHMSFFEGS